MKTIYFDHDGNVDDLVALILLLEMPNVNIIGIGVIGADSFANPAVDASRRIIDLLASQRNISIAKSNSRPVHEFPKIWRLNSYTFDAFPMLNKEIRPKSYLEHVPAHLDMVNKIKHSSNKVTLIMTGPLTDLARALHVDPSIQNNISKIYWMGGTMDNNGNVIHPEADGTQEWNAYWDPEAVKTVFNSHVPLVQVGLNGTKQVPLTNRLRQHWAQLRQYPAMELIGTGYSLVHLTDKPYYLWDVLTMLISYYPEISNYIKIRGNVITNGTASGRTYEDDNGRAITLANNIDTQYFYNCIDKLAKLSIK